MHLNYSEIFELLTTSQLFYHKFKFCDFDRLLTENLKSKVQHLPAFVLDCFAHS